MRMAKSLRWRRAIELLKALESHVSRCICKRAGPYPLNVSGIPIRGDDVGKTTMEDGMARAKTSSSTKQRSPDVSGMTSTLRTSRLHSSRRYSVATSLPLAGSHLQTSRSSHPTGTSI